MSYGANDLCYPRQIAFCQIGTGRKAESPLEEVLYDLAINALIAPEDRLHVHWFPQRPGLDILGLQSKSYLLAVRAEEVGLDQDASQPSGASSPWRLRHETQPWKITQ